MRAERGAGLTRRRGTGSTTRHTPSAGSARGPAAPGESRGAAGNSRCERLALTELSLAATERLAHVGSWQWNIGSDSVEWSDELYRIYGVAKGDFPQTYAGFAARVHPDDLRTTEGVLFAALRNPGPFAYQHRIVRPDGTLRMLDTHGEVITDEEGKPTCLLGNCWDITEGWTTTQKLEHSVSLLRATLESTADGILVVDTERHVAAYNERFLTLWRIPHELIDRHDDVALLSAVAGQLEDPEGFERVVERLYATPDEESHDVLRFVDGRIFERYSRPQRVGDEVVGRVWSFRDVTEKERLLATATFLAEATRLLVSLDFERALDAMARLAVPLLGDACVIDLIAGEGGPRRLVSVAQGIPDAELPEVPRGVLSGHQVIDKAGAQAVISVPLSGHDGVLGVMTFVERKGRMTGAREVAVIEELGRRVALCVDNARLYRRANDALRAREELISITSHEVRGPLAAQRLAIQSLQSEDVPEAARRRLLQLLSREGDRLTRFVDELTDATMIHAGRFAFELEPVSLPDVMRDVAARMAPELARSGSTLSVTVDGEIIGNWDRVRLDQVVTNLLSNAIKFGAGKPISIHAGLRGGIARLVVRDEGMGIAAANQARLFQPFERASSSRNFGGLGLGLYITRTIAEGLGGRVLLRSAEGDGATFTVELPLEQANWLAAERG